MSLEIHRGRLFHFPHDTHSPSEQYQYFDDGILVIKEGKIIDLGMRKTIYKHIHNPQIKLLITKDYWCRGL